MISLNESSDEKIKNIKKRIGELPFEIKLEVYENLLIVYFFSEPTPFNLLKDEEGYIVQEINRLRELFHQ